MLAASDSGRVGIAEAVAAIERGDDDAWAGILERECVNETEVITVAQCRARLDSEVRKRSHSRKTAQQR